MTYFKDLSRYEYSNSKSCAGEVRNVGWLDAEMPYPRGDADAELTAKLLALCKWPVNTFFGYHGCDFCQECPVRIADPEGEFCLGNGEIRVPAKDSKVVYAAPSLIYHYVAAHQYLPPAEFLDVLRDLTLPNPAVVWTLELIELIESFQHELSIHNLWMLLDEAARVKRPALPPEVSSAILEAANDLELADKTLGPDARQRAENIVGRLKSVLTRSYKP